ncbi:MAG: coproporphyrinogen III oxidase family protein [Lachnospiraceae bacterium]|nr:coproporphyrinogen III oxidase family protein [Lachnospiraceae bacterium]
MKYDKRLKSHHDAYNSVKERFRQNVDKREYVENILNHEGRAKRALYVHVPFCTKICTFCPFNKVNVLKRNGYDDYLIGEIDRISGYKYMKGPIDTVYFGGGTPTALEPKQMARVLRKIQDSFDIRENAEISVETSITELSDEMTEVLISGGVNRLSVGIQTFDDYGRKVLGRRGGGDAAADRLMKTKAAGITNLNIDLIYNWPGETPDILREDIARIKQLGLAGLSYYSLMLHEKTPLYYSVTEQDKARMGQTAWDKEQFDMIMSGLAGVGYKPFELTKMIRDGLDRYDYVGVRHSGGDCIAIGHGAGGNLSGYHYYNMFNAPLLGDDAPVSAMGVVESDTYMVIDRFINELQRMKVDLDEYGRLLGQDIYTDCRDILDRLACEGLIVMDGKTFSLTNDGMFWGNNIIDELLRRM